MKKDEKKLYFVVHDENVSEVSRIVSLHLNKGWQLYGELIVKHRLYEAGHYKSGNGDCDFYQVVIK